MKAETAMHDDFLQCPDTNPPDKVHFLVVQNLHFLQLSLLRHNLLCCHIAGLVEDAQAGMHYSSLTVKTQHGSNMAVRVVIVLSLQMALNELHSICYL